MKKGVTINLSNKVFYLLLLILGLFVFAGIAYATLSNTVPNPGHAVSDLQKCGPGEVLKMNSDGSAWTCDTSRLSCVSVIYATSVGYSVINASCPSGYTLTGCSYNDNDAEGYARPNADMTACECSFSRWSRNEVECSAVCCK